MAGPAVLTVANTIARSFLLAAQTRGDRPAIREKTFGIWQPTSWRQWLQISREIAYGLHAVGFRPGDVASIIANAVPEWVFADMGILCAGGVSSGIYPTDSAAQVEYLVNDSATRVIFAEDEEQLDKILSCRARCPTLRNIVVFDMEGLSGFSDPMVMSLAEFMALGSNHMQGREALWDEMVGSRGADDLAILVYTSGTTGPPKGCVISHGNYRAMVDMALSEGVIGGGKTTFLFLPLAHSFALLIQLATVDVGGCIAYWERDPLKIVPNLAEVKPEYFPSVPRIFEKIYTAATTGVEEAGGIKKVMFNWAIGVGKQMREAERSPGGPGALLKRKYALADKLVLHKIQDLFGGNIEQAITGAAPINPEILRFFDAAGVLILEGWGMTETSTAACVATPEKFKFGTVGRPFPGCELRIAEDGEVLVQGPNVFQGYYKNPDATAETLIDGWLHTGDIGEIDRDGFLKITGRKKDIIITAGGKNITPANLEAEIKQSRWVSQCVVLGDRRPYLIGLVTLDPEEIVKYAAENGLPEDPQAMAGNAELKAEIERHVDEINKKFARVEQVKKIAVLPQDLSQEAGELTPTLKVKRNIVAEKYEKEIEALYA